MGQVQLAKELGVSETMISLYETRRNIPTLERFFAICEVLSCTADDLLYPLPDPKQDLGSGEEEVPSEPSSPVQLVQGAS